MHENMKTKVINGFGFQSVKNFALFIIISPQVVMVRGGDMQSLSSGFIKKTLSNEEPTNMIYYNYPFKTGFAIILIPTAIIGNRHSKTRYSPPKTTH